MPGKLFILPNVLEESLPAEPFLPASVGQAVHQINGSSPRAKSRPPILRRFLSHDEMAKTPLRLLNEHTKVSELESLLQPMLAGETWGLISDAGLACVADPGADLVWLAREKGFAVDTFAGPSSIIMRFSSLDFLGQSFAFHGYLPREIPELEKKILETGKAVPFGGPDLDRSSLPILEDVGRAEADLNPATRLLRRRSVDDAGAARCLSVGREMEKHFISDRKRARRFFT